MIVLKKLEPFRIKRLDATSANLFPAEIRRAIAIAVSHNVRALEKKGDRRKKADSVTTRQGTKDFPVIDHQLRLDHSQPSHGDQTPT